MRHERLSQFTSGEVVLLCNSACEGNARKDSAAACSRRTWFSICSNRTSIGTCTDGTTVGTGARSEKKRAGATALTNGSWGGGAVEFHGSERIAAPNARATNATADTPTHKPIKSISMAETLLQQSIPHVVCQRWQRPNPFPFRRGRQVRSTGLPECHVEPDYSSVVDDCPHLCHHPAISLLSP
ncbi:hypothetical protein SBA1_490002 [Candidatus Sulfotelmatobacter kueseliae]|uniref:Uncharacterized protein n=1 Tax=Candidatus Sulfotelmatobacter kueseliae TaxID=2042962 RepID=A0A2U3KUV0_9BACT|nr:hypothetical protein SBA1_490002 [Candidatus Sulfotelmatobacter kueseliae]